MLLGLCLVIGVNGVFLPQISHAQGWASLPNLFKKDPAPEVPEATLADLERELVGVQQLLAKEVQLSASLPAEQALSSSERLRVLKSLAIALNERIKLSEEVAKSKEDEKTIAPEPAITATFSEPPPYSAIKVDLLREESELLIEQADHLTKGQAQIERDIASSLEQKRTLIESRNKANDVAARSKAGKESEIANSRRDLITLRLRLMDNDLSVALLKREKINLQLRRLKAQIPIYSALIERVLPDEQLSIADLEQQRKVLQETLEKLNQEIKIVEREKMQRLALRQNLAERNQKQNTPEISNHLRVLDSEIETDGVVAQNLATLQTLEQAITDAWGQRFVVLSDGSSEKRQAAVNALTRVHYWVTEHQYGLRESIESSRAALQNQRLLLDRITLNDDVYKTEMAILGSIERRIAAYERANIVGARIEHHIARWLNDFDSLRSSRAWWLRSLEKVQDVKTWLYGLRDFEVFSVQETAEVDGRQVSLHYGVTVGKIGRALLLFFFGYIVLSQLARLMQHILIQRFGVDAVAAAVLRRWSMIFALALLSVLTLNIARIPLTMFAFLGGALAIGVGFGTQTIIKNFISGIILLFERKVRVGDIIDVGSMTGGTVTEVDLRASTVRGIDGIFAVVPNSFFLENQFTNWTYNNRQVRRQVVLRVNYGRDPKKIAEVLIECAQLHAQVLPDPAPLALLTQFSESALEFTLFYWVDFANNISGLQVDSDVRFLIYDRFVQEGISMALPQRDVHLHKKSESPPYAAMTETAAPAESTPRVS